MRNFCNQLLCCIFRPSLYQVITLTARPETEKKIQKNVALIGEHYAWMRVSLVRGLCKVNLEAAVLQTQRRRRRRLSAFFKKLGQN